MNQPVELLSLPQDSVGRTEKYGDRQTGLAALVLVFVSLLFNPILCFIRTHGGSQVGAVHVIACELAILGAAAWQIRREVKIGMLVTAMIMTGWIVFLALINPEFDSKVLLDIAIIFLFFQLGTCGTPEAGDLLIRLSLTIVFAIGTYELLDLDGYLKHFDIYGFYRSKGSIDSGTTNYSNINLFISGFRPEGIGRTIMPKVFGAHRVSSIFLEPVSIGNFATICWAWLLTRFSTAPLVNTFFLVITSVIVAYGDSRFALMSCGILTLARFIPITRSRAVLATLPFAILGALLLGGMWSQTIESDNLAGRLVGAGNVMAGWGWGSWFGFEASPLSTVDAGYAYIICNIGLPLCAWMWTQLALTELHTFESKAFRTCVAIYVATGLCVGESVFSIKTAALLWFLYGAVQKTNSYLGQGQNALTGLRRYCLSPPF